MTNNEIDKALALAIGYSADRVRLFDEHWVRVPYIQVLNNLSRNDGPNYYREGWQRFDHLDWAVMGPIAELFDCFPKWVDTGWGAFCHNDLLTWVEASRSSSATALSVIKYWEGKA